MLSTLRFIVDHPLNRGHRLAALSRFLRWQLASLLMPEPIAVPFVGDTRLLMRKGMTGATGNWYCGLMEVHEMAFVLHLLRAGDLFIDIGANVGAYTVLAAGGVGARVIAVEPVPTTYADLMTNVSLNRLEDLVTAVAAGLSDSPGQLRFSQSLDTVNHVLEVGASGGIEVPVTTLDLVPGASGARLIKMDIEGFELPALRGATSVLASPGLLAVILETNGSGLRYGHSDADILALMAGFGFLPCQYDPFDRSLAPGVGARTNTIFVRDLAAVTAIVRAAERHTLCNGTI